MTYEEHLKTLILGKRVPYCCLQIPCEAGGKRGAGPACVQ